MFFTHTYQQLLSYAVIAVLCTSHGYTLSPGESGFDSGFMEAPMEHVATAAQMLRIKLATFDQVILRAQRWVEYNPQSHVSASRQVSLRFQTNQ